MAMKLLYLDIDGVLNDHLAQPNGYCGMVPECVARLNRILEAVPDLRLVISSSWRYLVLNGSMTRKGFEALLLTHGLACHERISGVTAGDELCVPFKITDQVEKYAWLKEHGEQIRAWQIEAHIAVEEPTAYVVLDDLDIPIEGLVRTDGARGLQDEDVEVVLARLAGCG